MKKYLLQGLKKTCSYITKTTFRLSFKKNEARKHILQDFKKLVGIKATLHLIFKKPYNSKTHPARFQKPGGYKTKTTLHLSFKKTMKLKNTSCKVSKTL